MNNISSAPIALPSIQSITKWTAAGLLAIYGLGFVVVSLYYAKFGFFESSPFRPRVIAAGVWFLVLVGLTVAIAVKLCPHEGSLGRQTLDLVWLLWVCYYASFYLGQTLFDFGAPQISLFGRNWDARAFYPLSAVIIVGVLRFGRRRQDSHPLIVTAIGFATICALFAFAFLPKSSDQSFAIVALEFWLTGFLATHFLVAWRRSGGDEIQWIIFSFAFLLSTLAGFASFIYPQIKASWGGGAPIPVVVYLSKDSRTLPSGELVGKLLEESDTGIFVTRGTEQHALFIPRSAVASVFYSDKPLTSDYFGGTAASNPAPAP